MNERTYIAIDLKSFYASVECVDRNIDPLAANLVVADESRTEKTICLAVSPALKSYGIPGRARLFEVIQAVRQINSRRRMVAPGKHFSGKSYFAPELRNNSALELDYIVAVPRMGRYLAVSSKIYAIYLRFVAAEDIHVYSIDEVFIDATSYLKLHQMTGREFAMQIIQAVLRESGITATAGIAPNLYLCKIAMDIVAKHIPPDRDGVRIAELDEATYRRKLWTHRPLSDFWRVGEGYAKRLAALGIHTMGEVARMSVVNDELLYKSFGVNAELLIDHAWGWEPCTIADIKNYRPRSRSMSSGQVLQEPYDFARARVVVMEMADQLALDLVEKKLICDQIILTVGFDTCSFDDGAEPEEKREFAIDHYGRKIPKSAHGSSNLGRLTASGKIIAGAVMALFDCIVKRDYYVRRLTIAANHIVAEASVSCGAEATQLDLFADYAAGQTDEAEFNSALEKERRMQCTILDIKKKFGKNAILKGTNLMDGATGKMRNEQIGGHKK
ncbi:MAG: DNA methylase [Lentisphaeria bacterium]|nr:DNA methylase [Lentisphaeria bacterium]